MKRSEFFRAEDVRDFVQFLTQKLPVLDIRLEIKPSGFVPGGLDVHLAGFQNVIKYYRWKPKMMSVGDWKETADTISGFRSELKFSVTALVDGNTLNVCNKIVSWGGDHNSAVGAMRFLKQKAEEDGLNKYLLERKEDLRLSTADTRQLSEVEMMNSMLTKIHAFLADDGLPIYDSRVAVAIATLVEMWRRDRGAESLPLPTFLAFPSADSNRRVENAYPDVVHQPPRLTRERRHAALWCSAKIRLGWLLEAVLDRCDQEEIPMFLGSKLERMHQFEACLFMIGSRPECITGLERSDIEDIFKRPATRKPRIKIRNTKVCPLLVKAETTIEYDYSEGAIKIFNSKYRATFDKIFLEDLLEHFKGREFEMGASRNQSSEGSLGRYLAENKKLTPQYASPLAAILVNEKSVTCRKSGRKVFLTVTSVLQAA